MVTAALLETSGEPLALLCLAAGLGSCFPDHTALHDKTVKLLRFVGSV